VKVEFTLNGQPVTVEGEPMERLLDVVREGQRLTGTKEGCGEGECGACTVLLDGEPVLSCLVPLVQCAGRAVETVEGVTADPEAKAILERFIEEGGTQCGACTPGIVVTAWRLKRGQGKLDRESIRTALAGNLCRCTGYEAILRALDEEAPR
jgi:aerobic-type carbon monoxide dehydrogenase small subunit (CoxS/CutS family)